MKHKAGWAACALIAGIDAFMLLPKPGACQGGGCNASFTDSGVANLLSPTNTTYYTGNPNSNSTLVTFQSSHSLSETRTDCPNNCSVGVNVYFKNGDESGTITSASSVLTWPANQCGTQNMPASGTQTITGSAYEVVGQHTGWAKTVADSTLVAWNSVYFSVASP